MPDTSPPTPPTSLVTHLLREIWQAVGGDAADLRHVAVTGAGSLPSAFHVSDLATAAIGAASLAVAELVATQAGALPAVQVDRRLAAIWFGTSLRPQGWDMPPPWDPVAGDYRTADGWIRLHTNAPHHRDAAMAVLKTPVGRDAVTRAVATWSATELESAIVAHDGCAAAMRPVEAWAAHPQGRAVHAEPLLHRTSIASGARAPWMPKPGRPLQGLRVLDLTRILAGPVATRFLAGFGAQVLRIDPPGWEEPFTVPEVVLGKRCARLDLKTASARRTLETLLTQADVLVHGYRPDALMRLGFDPARRRALNPNLIDVSLDAYGWSGPWQGRRGFDSLIQMSTGIAEAGMRAAGRDRPTPLPNQAIDHATGYLLAAAAVRGLTQRLRTGEGLEARASLARTAHLLISAGHQGFDAAPIAPETPADWSDAVEATGWGPARRVRPPSTIAGVAMRWDLPAPLLGSSPAAWVTDAA
ncbi:CoA transferase [Bradyrhizobium sp. U87765 SZCCT0131]|uniref:CoA transferase n=1 Tax=unclassified Bradyrhizobium TaxID=2631580 RepID=UPI001BAB0378|nr:MULTISPECIES: CoA transferase [unclassified Bradyrhizobium]MBR1216553.1 CoA transferase [Bradyrhizobium sp. U87765 SZCCT0131]MBR1259691.1 CoA transferase [Bradyrhizobium sp. U87765 SZCCT0134]MBR1305832.1 CoA transferase [Bradyrhizobium sp. U87765 SZCCT0110]MBR1322199.1 CoA transferase [Bradyrhizobium sp. U87765 SZCCT0109]MBR1350522.1 CoA transferase [Bradyrhizobium sp. U87765 SZCCT0048]